MADIKALDVYYWTATLRSFSAAANKCNMTQSAVSQRIAALENEFGIPLLLRNNGSIRLGCVESIAYTWLDNFVRRMSDAYPFVSIDVSIGTSDRLRSDLQHTKIDLALLLGPSTNHDLIETSVGQMKLAWIVSSDMKLGSRIRSIDDISSHTVLTYSRNTLPYSFIKALFSQSRVVRPRICGSGSLTTIIKMIKSGSGVGLIPKEVVRQEINAGDLQLVDSDIVLPCLNFFASYYTNSVNDIVLAAFKIAQCASNDWYSNRSFA